jgi:hypothetical protein
MLVGREECRHEVTHISTTHCIAPPLQDDVCCTSYTLRPCDDVYPTCGENTTAIPGAQCIPNSAGCETACCAMTCASVDCPANEQLVPNADEMPCPGGECTVCLHAHVQARSFPRTTESDAQCAMAAMFIRAPRHRPLHAACRFA